MTTAVAESWTAGFRAAFLASPAFIACGLAAILFGKPRKNDAEQAA